MVGGPVDLSTRLGPLELEHPVMNASGTFDVLKADGVLKADLLGNFPFSAYVPKTVTLEARAGNEPPRLHETAAGLLNSIGLANPGMDDFIEHDLPRLASLPAPLIVSVAGERVDDYGRCAGILDSFDEISAIELNISCPNVDLDGRALGCDPERTVRAVELARGATEKFLIVKLTPNVTDIIAEARAAVEGGADCLSMINTVHGMALDSWTLKPALGHMTGGLSGPAIKPVALRAIYMVTGSLDVPVIGMGGATTGQDVLEFLAAGASAVAIGTASFRDPLVSAKVVAELEDLMAARGIGSVAELCGRAHDR